MYYAILKSISLIPQPRALLWAEARAVTKGNSRQSAGCYRLTATTLVGDYRDIVLPYRTDLLSHGGYFSFDYEYKYPFQHICPAHQTAYICHIVVSSNCNKETQTDVISVCTITNERFAWCFYITFRPHTQVTKLND